MMADIDVPRLRENVRIREINGQAFAEDPARWVRVPLDALSVELLRRLAEGPRTISAFLEAFESPPTEILERLRLFDRHVLLDTAHAREQIAVATDAAEVELWPREALVDAPLDIASDLAHECVACGAACNCADIGPLTERDIAHIRSTDWRAHLPDGVEPDELVGVVEMKNGETVSVTGSRHSRCIFLNDDKLCAIHAHLGYDKKPTICQQFPMTLTRTPTGIAPSYAMECRSWWQARQAAQSPPAEAEIRALVAAGAPILDIPIPIPVWHGLDWPFERWLAYRAAAQNAVREASDLAGIVDALASPLVEALAVQAEGSPDDERFLSDDAWGIETPVEAVDAGPIWFDQRCRAFATGFEHIVDPLIDSYRSAGELYHALTLDLILEILFLTMRHERLVLGSRMAAYRARSTFRVKTTEQDVIDSLIVVTKMLRGTALIGELPRLREDLVSLFLLNADSFTRGTMPAKVGYVRGSRVLGTVAVDAR